LGFIPRRKPSGGNHGLAFKAARRARALGKAEANAEIFESGTQENRKGMKGLVFAAEGSRQG